MRLSIDGLFILVSGITTEEDALLSIGLGASAVGFDFSPSPWHVDPHEAEFIMRRLPNGALTVGSFRNDTPQHIVATANHLGLSAVNLCGVMTQSEINWVSERVNTVIRTVPEDDFVRDVPGADYLLVPEDDTLAELQANFDVFFDDSIHTPLIVGGGVSPAIVTEVIQTLPVWGIQVNSTIELVPGVKAASLMAEFIANAKWAYDNPLVEGG